ncbi:MAG TPA: DUF4129 domain-containing protein [Ktedonobacteraceae bacterium]|jgi:hypothetical protein|nr:DUF4129 domain-containing protein [Ktedonobacteraceae bacterium]
MASSPKQPEQEKDARRYITPVQWLKRVILTPQESGLTSIGELFIPTLLAAMETCWIDAIFIWLAGIHIFGSSEPLMPFWGPFILIGGSQWLLLYAEQRAGHQESTEEKEGNRTTSGNGLYIGLIFVVAAFLIWLHIYAQKAFILDPRWLLNLSNDILLLNLNFFQMVAIIVLSLLFGWRGIRLLQLEVEPSHVFRELCLGLGIMVAVIVLRAGQESAGGSAFIYDTTLLLLIPIFLFLSLAAHALARVTFIRRTHPVGLQGSVVVQERAIVLLIGSIGIALLLVTLLVGGSLNPSILRNVLEALAPLGIVYQWLITAFAAVATLIITPFFWLAAWWFSHFPNKYPTIHQATGPGTHKIIIPPVTRTSPEVILTAKILMPILLLLVIFLLVRWALSRRRRVRVATRKHSGDTHESLWSWSLFWMQLKALLRGLLRRFFPQQATVAEKHEGWEEIRDAEPAVRTIREIYRALLRKAAYRGYARKKDETPYEFRRRLDEKAPLVEPQLEVITEAYALTRYGGDVPDEAEVAHIRSAWTELEQKWS